MIFLFFNLPGAVILFAGFVIAFMGCAGFGRIEAPLIFLIAGIAITALDLLYRSMQTPKFWFEARGGGMLFFLPIWFCGLTCTVLAALDLAGMG